MSKRLYSGRYEVQEFIADGEMGAVHKAWDNTSFDHMVALHVIHSHLSSDASFIERFRDAARKTMQLQTHPNIIKILDVEHDHGIDYLVMEYFPSTNLRDCIQTHGKFRIQDATHVIRQIGEALSHTHSCDLLHRDIKPSNILLDNNQQAKLTDFGIAKAMSDAPLTATGQLIGTLKYMSPEQAGHLKLDERTDLYSLGMVFYELVTGKNLWNHIPNLTIYGQLQTEKTVPPLHFPPGVPQEIQEIIKDLLRFDPLKRVQNAQSLISRLENLEPISSNAPLSKQEEDSDITLVRVPIEAPVRQGDDTTEEIHRAPTNPTSTQAPSVPLKGSVTKQTSDNPSPPLQHLEDDPAEKAKDPAKPYYFVDDSHSFNKHREETEAKKPLFSDQFPAPNPHSSHSFFTIKKMLGIAFIFLVGAALYWNQAFFSPSQPSQEKLVFQETENREFQEINEQNFTETLTSDLNQQTTTTSSTQITEIAQQTKALPDIQAADVAQQATVADDIQATKLSQQTPAATNVQTEDLAKQANVIAEAQADERAKQTQAAADAQAAQRAKEAQAAAAEAAIRTKQAQATAAAQIDADIQTSKISEQDQAGADAQAAKAQAEELYQQAKAATEARAAELAKQAQATANAQAAERARQTQVAAKTQAAERARQAQAEAAETQALMRLLEELRGSVVKKDLSALKRLSTMSESRYRMLNDLFSRYRTVEVSIGDVIRTAARATATLQITKLIRPNGMIVQPHPIVQDIKVTILKDEAQWNLPAW